MSETAIETCDSLFCHRALAITGRDHWSIANPAGIKVEPFATLAEALDYVTTNGCTCERM